MVRVHQRHKKTNYARSWEGRDEFWPEKNSVLGRKALNRLLQWKTLDQLKNTSLRGAPRDTEKGQAWGSWDRKECEGSLPLLEVLCTQNWCLTGFTISNSFKLPLQWLFVFCLPHLYLFYAEIKKKNNHTITSADWTFKIITFQRNSFLPR